MNAQSIQGLGFNPSLEQLEEQVTRHQAQIRALHFEIAKRQMHQASQQPTMNIDAFQGGFEGTKPSVMVNPFGMQTSFQPQQVATISPLTPFEQMPKPHTQNNLEKPMRTKQWEPTFGQPTSNQNVFGDNSPTKNTFEQKPLQNNIYGQEQQSNISFGQMDLNDSPKKSPQKSSFGHPSQSSIMLETIQQPSNAFERPKTAPCQASDLTPNGRMIKKNEKFLGRVQAVPTEGFAVSIKRLGKAKFFDYKTVAECLQEWAQQ